MKSSLNKKGFTLVELLAVLVVLAILALIGIPIVVNVIEGARISARQRSVDAYGKAAEYAISVYMLDQESSDDDTAPRIAEIKAQVMADETVADENKEEKIAEKIAEYEGLPDADKEVANNTAAWNMIEPTIDYKGDRIKCTVKFERANGTFTLTDCYIGPRDDDAWDNEKVKVINKPKKGEEPTSYTYSSTVTTKTTQPTPDPSLEP